MPLSQLPTLLLYILVVGYTPGPANLYAFSCAIKYGTQKAKRMWRGMFVGFSLDLLAVVLCVHFVGETFGEYIYYLKYFGAAYIAYLAWGIFRSGTSGGGGEADGCTFWQGFIVQLTNVKMILFELTVFSVFVLPYSSEFSDLLWVGLWLHLAGPGANLLWLNAGEVLRNLLVARQRSANIVMALALLLCAVMILLPIS